MNRWITLNKCQVQLFRLYILLSLKVNKQIFLYRCKMNWIHMHIFFRSLFIFALNFYIHLAIFLFNFAKRIKKNVELFINSIIYYLSTSLVCKYMLFVGHQSPYTEPKQPQIAIIIINMLRGAKHKEIKKKTKKVRKC